ncbi:MAG TPA: hypothetical protein PKC67_02495 [Kiritimatiellia bacterium]|nr:hypothetical protein [Kiritimatiellia bacterium]HMP33195.1 hypothetical protein [Kiritimatiellia bacterium]
MKPTDFRDMTFEDLQQSLSGMRRSVYEAWLLHGPGTTAEVALRAQISLLTFRPRTTDLYQAGLVELQPGQKAGHEGRYRAVTMAEWQRRKASEPVKPEQTLMPW